MTAAGRLDWPALMRLAIFEARLRPAEFWALSPAELMVVLGTGPLFADAAPAMTRSRLCALMARFPEPKPQPDT